MKQDLKKLRDLLIQKNCFISAMKVAQVISSPKNIEGEIPDFAWLFQGNLFRKMLDMGLNKQVDDFIEENSEILSEFDIKKYLGSGEIGDAWLLDDGMVLKIFDSGATTNDISKYENLRNALFEGTADPGDPMIYEVNEFERPYSFEGKPSPSKHNQVYPFMPAYALIEKVDNYDALIDSYMKHNSGRFDINFDEEGNLVDAEGNIIEDEDLYRPIQEDIITPEMRRKFQESVLGEDYEEFIEKYFKQIINLFIENFTDEYFNYKLKLGDAKILRPDDWEDDDTPYDLNDPSDRKRLALQFLESAEMQLPEGSLGTVEELLGLETGWLESMAATLIETLHKGRTDVHAGNFGFRNGRVVFFDA